MKNLPQMVDDLRALAAFLVDGASDLEELMRFLGGAVTPQPPPPPPPPPAPPHISTAPPQPKNPDSPERDPNVRRTGVRKGGQPRTLSEPEKQAIRADWESLPNHQRTAVNRTALSLKHRCSIQQFFALTRTDGHLQKMTAASARIASQQTQNRGEIRETR